VKRHAEALAQRGDQVDVLCLECGLNGLTNGVNVIGLQMPRYRGASRFSYAGSYLRFFAMATRRTLQLSRKAPYDIVMVCTMPDAAVLCALPARLYGSRIVLDIHDTMPELYQEKFEGRRGAIGARLLMLGERWSARCADTVLAVHEPHRARLVRAGLPGDKIRVVMNAPDGQIFRPAERDYANGKDGRFNLICHGTLARRLGLDVAIEALALVHPRVPAATLTVMGAGDFLEQARALTDRLGLNDCVHFEGLVPIERLPALLSRADVGLVPNRPNSATHLMLPGKLLDYAKLGIPTIAARLATIEHYFGDDAVRYFEPGQSAQLAAAIEELYRQPERRAALAANALRIVERIGWPLQRVEYYRAIDALLPASWPEAVKGMGTKPERTEYMEERT
jgi:glycosyltransferase involved in cell wall biosynthesis